MYTTTTKNSSRLSCLCLVVGTALASWPALSVAATPATMAVEGVLRSMGGGPVADGQYLVTFALYTAPKGGTAVWKEGPAAVGVSGGRFIRSLGATTPIKAATFAGISKLWLGVTVAPDDELTRTPVHSVLFSRRAEVADGLACSGCVKGAHLGAGAISADKIGFTYAGAKTKGGPANTALDVQCTGCVGISEMKFDGTLDLGGNGLKAKAVTASAITAGSISATTYLGDGSKLSGIKIPSGVCKNAGEVVKGINADGTLQCVKAMDPKGLPADGLDEISNGQLSTEFLDKDQMTKAMPIPDNNPKGITSTLAVPDRGIAKSLSVSVVVTNSDFTKLKVSLTDPAGGKHVLFDGGKVVGGTLKGTFPAPNKPKSSDLSTWAGKNPKGKWTLQVVDSAFKNNTFDGALQSWSVDVLTLSNKKVQAPGTLIVGDRMIGAVQLKTALKPPVTCNKANVGYMYVDPVNKTMNVCNGEAFFPLAIAVFGTKSNPGANCAHILSVHPAAKSGKFWVDGDGLGGDAPWETYCDMETDGGGWTRFVHHSDANGKTKITKSVWDAGITRAAKGGIKEWIVKTFSSPSQNSATGAKYVNAWSMKVAANVQGTKFTFFKHQPISACNKHRYSTASYISSAKILPGSECKSWHGSYSAGRHLWGEHKWCGKSSLGWMWMSHCGSPSYHMLIVNHDYTYPARYATMVGSNHGGGKWKTYDEDGSSFEFFFR